MEHILEGNRGNDERPFIARAGRHRLRRAKYRPVLVSVHAKHPRERHSEDETAHVRKVRNATLTVRQ